MKMLIRLILWTLGLSTLLILLMAGIIAADSLFPAQRVSDFANISFPGQDGITRQGYLAKANGSDPAPGILLVHEFFGLNESIVKKANLLADQGYTVLAVDTYRGKSTRLIPRAIWLALTTPQEQINADIDAGYDFLSGMDGVDSNRTGAVGFCFGGTQIMHLGRRNPNLAATVIFYGSDPITNADALGHLGENGPVLGIFGERDRQIPLSEVYAFEAALADQGVSHRVTVYPDVGHAFVQFEAILLPGPAQDAWQEMLVFLDEALKK